MSDNPKISEEKVAILYSQLELPIELEAKATITFELCPECGVESVVQTGKCKLCMTCGWSLCSL